MIKSNLLSIDLAKDVFQVAGFSHRRKVLFNKKFKRSELLAFMAQQPPTEVLSSTTRTIYTGIETYYFP